MTGHGGGKGDDQLTVPVKTINMRLMKEKKKKATVVVVVVVVAVMVMVVWWTTTLYDAIGTVSGC